MLLQLLENILGDTKDGEEPSCSYDNVRQKRKCETAEKGKSKKIKVRYFCTLNSHTGIPI
jgi:hypothetical protein